MSLLRAATILSKSELGLWRALANLEASESSTTLFALNAPQSSLPGLFSNISSRFRSNNIGCLSSPISPDYLYSVSYLSIPCSMNPRIWRSIIPGERSQVGRWYSPEQRNKESFDLSSDATGSSSRVAQLPSALQKLKQDGNKISGLLYFTDNSTDGLRESLRYHLPPVPQLGLIAATTPFITGRPFTLFQDGKFYSDGAIGIAFTGEDIVIGTDASNLETLAGSPSMTVTSASTNLIYEFDGKSAARTTGQHLTAAGRNNSGHDLLSTSTGVYLGERGDDGELFRVYAISGGSFHSGQLLLDGDVSPPVGTVLELVTAKPSYNVANNSRLGLKSSVQAKFLCLPPSDEWSTDTDGTQGNTWGGKDFVEESSFIAASETGFTLNEGKDTGRSWMSRIPFTQGIATFAL